MNDAAHRRAVVVSRNGIDIVTELLTEVSAGHARVKLSHAGICHSDIAAIASGTITGPAHIGHEASGVVVESRIPGLDAGTRVVAYATDAYATHVDVPHDRIVVLDPGCSTLDAALAEPVACVIGAIEMLPLADCSEIVLVGAGFMGLLAVRHLALLGHAVTVVEPIEARRAVALGAGAVRALHPDSVLSEYPSGTAIVIEATGSAGGLALAGDLVAIGGTLGILGYHQSENGMRTVPMERWNFRAMSVLSLHHRSAERMMRWIDRAQRSAAQGGIVPSEFVDAYFGLSDAALALAMTPADRAPVKAVLTFQ